MILRDAGHASLARMRNTINTKGAAPTSPAMRLTNTRNNKRNMKQVNE